MYLFQYKIQPELRKTITWLILYLISKKGWYFKLHDVIIYACSYVYHSTRYGRTLIQKSKHKGMNLKIWHVFGGFPKMAELRLYMRPQMCSTQKISRHVFPACFKNYSWIRESYTSISETGWYRWPDDDPPLADSVSVNDAQYLWKDKLCQEWISIIHNINR